MSRPIACLFALAAAGCFGSTPEERFLVAPLAELAPFERTHARDPLEILLDPDFSVPSHLRPCCAFGRDLRVSMAALPVPMVQVQNVLAPDEIGEHAYDGGLVSLQHGVRKGFVSSEANGLLYTCRGGFIDLAHVRDYADWTAFLARRIEASLSTGAAFELPAEGGRRFVFLTRVDDALVESVGARVAAVRIAGWLAFQLSAWHESATWFGWSSLDLFPEVASAFSPEDLYSNLLGIQLASYAIEVGAAESEADFNRAMGAALASALRTLGALPRDGTRRALEAVDGLWWDSGRRLPELRVVLRRNFELGPGLIPWRISEPWAEAHAPRFAQDLNEHCRAHNPAPAELRYSTDLAGRPIEELARMDVELEPALAQRIPRGDPGSRWLSQAELADLVVAIRADNERIFGVGFDGPAPVQVTR